MQLFDAQTIQKKGERKGKKGRIKPFVPSSVSSPNPPLQAADAIGKHWSVQ